MLHSLSDDGLALAPQSSGPFPSTVGGGRHVGAERTVVVHRMHDPKQVPSPVDQLLTHARTIVPAVLNYIYFGAADMAVVYFGKSVRNGQKVGVDGADDMKIRMLRFLTTEIWPQLLRTDVPDESQAAPDAAVESPLQNKLLNLSIVDGDEPITRGAADNNNTENLELAASARLKQTQRQQWLRKSLESGMQVLVYLKPGAANTKYLKLVLSNSPRRIHFDIVDSREEKFRWDNRMLHIRMLDNLETQKAIDSYETYERYFREATTFASKHCAELEKPDQPLVSVVFHDGFPHPEVNGVGRGGLPSPAVSPALTPRSHSHDYPKVAPLLLPAATFLDASQKLMSPSCSTASERSRRRYIWFENLEKPESLTLDYKSYFMHPAMEIHHRAVKFMCGFLNGIGQGKLVVGVHEMERADLADAQRRPNKQQRNFNATTTEKNNAAAGVTNASLGDSPPLLQSSSVGDLLETAGNTIVTHNMLVEQLVVGIAISDQEIAALQMELSEQLQLCIPPIPPQAVQLDIIPIVFPVERLSPGFLVLFFDTSQSGWKDGFRQKGNNAIRQLRKFGYSLCPYDFTERSVLHDRFPKLEALLPKDATGIQLYAVCPTGSQQPTPSTTTAISSSDAFPTDPSLSSGDNGFDEEGHPRKSTPTPSSPDPSTQQLTSEWLQKLMDTCAGRNKGKHIVHEVPNLILPELRIVEISVNITRCPEPLRSAYKGKFFNGWPSIPIWNPMTDMITRVDRNYHIFSTSSTQRSRSRRSGGKTNRTASPSGGGAADDAPARSEEEGSVELQSSGTLKWYYNAFIVSTVLAFSCGSRRTTTIKLPRMLLRLRLLHSSFNTAFEKSLGVPIVEMLRSTPVGSPGFSITRETVSLLQTSLRVSRLSTLPLLLVHVYEMLGSLLSPFPYVAAPVSMQSIRLHPKLLPLYMYHDYETMTFRADIVLDTEDGFIKVIRGSPITGAFTLEVVQGIGFAKVSRKLLESRAKQASLPKAFDRARSLRRIKLPPTYNRNSSAITSLNTSVENNNGMLSAAARCDTAEYLTPRTSSGSGMASPQTSSGGEPQPTSGVTTVRKLESNVPLLRFSFLYGDHQKLFHTTSWTLGTLLNWLHAVAHTPGVRPFGYCDRSFGFYPDFSREVCVAHLGDDELFDGCGDGGGSEPSTSHHESPLTSVYASSFDCSVCRLMVEWNSSH